MIKLIFGAAMCLVLMAIGYHFAGSASFKSWLSSSDTQPKLIKFENDVRDTAADMVPQGAASAVSAVTPSSKRNSGMRKCRKGDSMIYTDDLCPPGYKEQELKNGTVTVVPTNQL